MRLEDFTVEDLRKMAKAKALGSGVWRAGASKAELIRAIQDGHVSDASSTDDLGRVLASAIVGQLPLDRLYERIEKQIEAAVAAIPPKQIEIKRLDGSKITLPKQHAQFAALLAAVAEGDAVCMVGPAGSGKSHAAEMVAKALGLEFECISLCPATTKGDIVGYRDATRNYATTPFREAFEFGKVLMIDEIDNANPAVMPVVHTAMEQGYCRFPDRMVKRHPNCRFIAGANTYGMGANRVYCGRTQQDGATRDRWSFMPWRIDDDLEDHLCPDKPWLSLVRSVRQEIDKKGVRLIVSPRASIKGARLLELGFDLEETVEMTIWKGLDHDTKASVLKALEENGAYIAAKEEIVKRISDRMIGPATKGGDHEPGPVA